MENKLLSSSMSSDMEYPYLKNPVYICFAVVLYWNICHIPKFFTPQNIRDGDHFLIITWNFIGWPSHTHPMDKLGTSIPPQLMK